MRIPIEKVTSEVIEDGQTIEFVHVILVFGIPVFARRYDGKVIGKTGRTSGFDVFPDDRVEVEDDDE